MNGTEHHIAKNCVNLLLSLRYMYLPQGLPDTPE